MAALAASKTLAHRRPNPLPSWPLPRCIRKADSFPKQKHPYYTKLVRKLQWAADHLLKPTTQNLVHQM